MLRPYRRRFPLPALSRRSTAELLLFGTTFIWASTFIVLKWGLTEWSPLFLLAVRFTIAVALYAVLFPSAVQGMTAAALRRGSLLALFFTLGCVLQTVGLQYTTASKSAFITGMMAVFTPLVQYVWERRPPTRANLISIAIVIVGLWLLTNPSAGGSAGGSAAGGLNRGDLLTLFCAISFACYIVYLDLASRHHEPLVLTFAQIGPTTLYCWLGVLLETPRAEPSWMSVSVIVYLAVAATILTGFLMTRYQKETTPTRIVVIYSVEPVWTALAAAALLGERLTAVSISGGGLILVGVLLTQLADAKPDRV
ncbi:MAG TPA: DMT family transporter [Nitrospiria bacterium]|nr:DMT family transporter [Nitrospiria bacterium]